jgi:translocation and assembly module TamA
MRTARPSGGPRPPGRVSRRRGDAAGSIAPLPRPSRTRSAFLGGTALLSVLVGVALAQDAPPPLPSVPYTVDLPPSGDEALDTGLHDASNLIALEAETPPSALGLIRRAQADLERLANVLGALGYYGGSVTITIDGRPLDDPELGADLANNGATPAKVAITIETGEVYTFDAISIQGPDGKGPPAVPVSTEGLGLERGAPALAATIVAAEADMLTQMQAQGHPLARVAGRDAAIDRTTDTMDLTEYLDAGPKAGFGLVTITGNSDVETDFIASRVPFVPGENYDPAQVTALRKDLVDLGVFNSVRISTSDTLDADGNVPVSIEVAERPPRFIGFGAQYSTDQGFGANAYWGHRNLFGRAEQFRIDAAVSGIAQNDVLEPNASLIVTFKKPGFIWREQTLNTRAAIDHTVYDGYTATTATGFIGVEHQWTDEILLTGGLELRASHIEEDTTGDQTLPLDYVTASLPLGATIDTTDNPLDATRGFKLNLTLQPTVGLSGVDAAYVTMRAAGSTYFDVVGDGSLVLSARASIGSILGADLQDVPLDQRFYAGGSDTIRGYGFQRVGPKDEQDDPTGGLSVLTVGLEARYRITESIGAVAFVEGGGVFEDSVPDFGTDIQYAAGIGGRYYTSLGPIRVDVAFPLNPQEDDDSFQLYISLGQAF